MLSLQVALTRSAKHCIPTQYNTVLVLLHAKLQGFAQTTTCTARHRQMFHAFLTPLYYAITTILLIIKPLYVYSQLQLSSNLQTRNRHKL